jgi:hypothetical protein
VGVIAGSVYETNLERDFPTSPLRRFDSLDEMMTAVGSGETSPPCSGSLQIDYHAPQSGDGDLRRHRPGHSPASDIRIAVRPDAPNLLRWVNLYLAGHVGMLDDAEIVQRYLDAERVPVTVSAFRGRRARAALAAHRRHWCPLARMRRSPTRSSRPTATA